MLIGNFWPGIEIVAVHNSYSVMDWRVILHELSIPIFRFN